MALFKSKKEEAKAEEPKVEKKSTQKIAAGVNIPAAARVLVSARVTEKATDLSGKNVYVFNVVPSANKRQVVEAVKALYKVTPKEVRMVQVPRKRVRHPRAGVLGASARGKKAYVQLKDGDTISLM